MVGIGRSCDDDRQALEIWKDLEYEYAGEVLSI